jgi:hypothetical protein
MFKNFARFRVLVCGGDGSVSWVLSLIDVFGLHERVSPWLTCSVILERVGVWSCPFEEVPSLHSP